MVRDIASPDVPRRATFGLGSTLATGSTAGHIVLLGDSVLDNVGYLAGSGRDVLAQLRSALPAGWRATLLAHGGATALEVREQVQQLPPDATHIVFSAGGNDAGRQEP